MRKIALYTTLALGIALSACSGPKPTKSNVKTQKTMEISNKQKVVDLLKSIETGAQEPAGYINPNKYIQHNLGVADGLEGFGAVLQQLPPNSAKANTVRAFQDGDFVFTQTDYNFFGPKIGFDLFRFENGKIVEHWDNLQEKPNVPNPSSHTMIDGPTSITDLNKTEDNKALVSQFVNDILVNGKMDKIGNYIDGENYTQHNPQIADGLSGLGQAFEYMASQGITMTFSKVHKVLGEGNFVLSISEGSFAGNPTSFYDLFRVDQGKIVEHWDVIQTIPAQSEWKNSNGKF